MPHSPVLTLVERRVPPRSAFLRGLPSAVVGVVVGLAGLVPFLLSVLAR